MQTGLMDLALAPKHVHVHLRSGRLDLVLAPKHVHVHLRPGLLELALAQDQPHLLLPLQTSLKLSWGAAKMIMLADYHVVLQ